MTTLPRDNLKYPVRVTLSDTSSASGFYFRSERNLFFVTAKHVLVDQRGEPPTITLRANSAALFSYPVEAHLNEPVELRLDLSVLQGAGFLKLHPSQDVAVIKICEIAGNGAARFVSGTQVGLSASGRPIGTVVTVPPQNVKSYDDVSIGNDVFIFGYPTSLGIQNQPQIEYAKPLLRKGVVAGKNNQAKTIILDCPVYPGNSGGPVIEEEQVDITSWSYKVIGIVSQFVPYVDVWENKRHGNINTYIDNSGYSVVTPMDVMMELTAD